MSGRFLSLAGLAYVLVFIGLVTFQGGVVTLAIPLLVYVAATLLFQPPAVKLRVERILSADTLIQRKPVEVTVRITNEGAALDEVTVQDTLPAGMRLTDGKTDVLTSMPAGSVVELVYSVSAPRGYYSFSDVTVRARDHLGVQRSETVFSAYKRVIYLPELTKLRKIAIRPHRTHGHYGPIPSRQPGSGVDFYGLREYQMGDPRRWINWRASARQEQRLFVNQFEQERIADVGIILDAREQSDVRLPDGQSLFEYGVQAAGSLSDALLHDGNRVGLLVYGFGVERTFPGYGKVQQKRIVQALGRTRTGHNFALETLGFLPTRFFPTGSQIIMVSPLMLDDAQPLMQLRASGYEVLVVSPNPVDFEARGLNLYGGLAWQTARIERALLLRRLQRYGIRIFDWPVDQDFESLVRNTLGHLTPGRRLDIRGSL